MGVHLLSDASEYALRAVVCLARHEGESLTAENIAERTRCTYGHLARVLHLLRRAKIVHGKRGVAGGYTLLSDPSTLTVLDVINLVDPIERITTCPLGLAEHSEALCALHACIDDAIERIHTTFSQMTIADIVGGPSPRSPLCDLTTGVTDAAMARGSS